ncbi:MAG: hypothetical protein KME47_09345 [Nodosilinea sp. WJT8-NPBG4]|jgi:hypothetical protein|nr:hypothetical protein [Nodosilinea sp. WJT8-NPBG4]
MPFYPSPSTSGSGEAVAITDYGFSLPEVTIANNVTDINNDIDFSAGRLIVTNGTTRLSALFTAKTKRLDAAWVAGNNVGGLDTGNIANTTYHCYAIFNPATSANDFIFSISATAPTLPSGYTHYRRVGSIIRNGGFLVPFIQRSDTFLFVTSRLDVDTTIATTQTNYTVSVPLGISVRVIGNLDAGYTVAASNNELYIAVGSPAVTLPSNAFNNSAYNYWGSTAIDFRQSPSKASGHWITNTSAQLAFIKAGPGVYSLNTKFYTHGWEDINLAVGK